jgi:hypothetical protein
MPLGRLVFPQIADVFEKLSALRTTVVWDDEEEIEQEDEGKA